MLSKPEVSFARDVDHVKLTHYTHGLGCACKLRPQLLEQVLAKMPVVKDSNVIVGIDTADDAAVYRISDDVAIVQTVDFFTPIVDDPYDFGAIAAANSLSDVYAMGAKPLFALSVVGFPSSRLPTWVLESILKGASDKAREAGVLIIGGHTVDDTEPKFGLAVTGVVDPKRVIKNSGARVGDMLVLTKPIGTGILTTALKRGIIDEEMKKLLVATMASLNSKASEAMQAVGVNACTDVTGFGLLGHLLEMVRASNVSAEIKISEIDFLPQALDLAASGCIPGGTMSNVEYTSPHVKYAEGISDLMKTLINDAQTSGGLLISVPESRLDQLTSKLNSSGCSQIAVIGRIVEKGGSWIVVLS
ncbi:MAG: selenide, water dikinase SelD [bacterium]